MPAYYRARAGIGYAPEDRRLVADISVEENIVLPGLALKLDKSEIKRRLDEIYATLETRGRARFNVRAWQLALNRRLREMGDGR